MIAFQALREPEESTPPNDHLRWTASPTGISRHPGNRNGEAEEAEYRAARSAERHQRAGVLSAERHLVSVIGDRGSCETK